MQRIPPIIAVKIVRPAHFQQEQAADEITESEIAVAWMRPELERDSQDHPGGIRPELRSLRQISDR